MTRQTSGTTHLSGWLQPGECYYSSDSLYLLVIGSFAGEASQIRLTLHDAAHHGYPASTDYIDTRFFGNWLELAGAFEPSPRGEEARDNDDHTGYLTIESIRFSHRMAEDPRKRLGYDLPRKLITALFPAAAPGPEPTATEATRAPTVREGLRQELTG
jgi:hypothetical protein